MSVYSMTGYASGHRTVSTQAASAVLAAELRCVNSRFLDISLKLCEELRPLEGSLREIIQQRLRRGKLELRLGLGAAQDEGASSAAAPHAQALQHLLRLQDAVLAHMPQARALSVAEALRLLSEARSTVSCQDVREQVLQAVQALLHDLQAARATEGAQLAAALMQRVERLRALTAQAAGLAPQLMQQQQARFLEKWHAALQAAGAQGSEAVTPEIAQARALSEAAAFALRIDVAEEITRLQAHLDTIAQLLDKGGELGKRLDFLIQELHREANTLASKSAVLEMSHIAVDMKVLIEQMREQVQNLE